MICQTCHLELVYKFSSPHDQKGVYDMIVPQEDISFNETALTIEEKGEIIRKKGIGFVIDIFSRYLGTEIECELLVL